MGDLDHLFDADYHTLSSSCGLLTSRECYTLIEVVEYYRREEHRKFFEERAEKIKTPFKGCDIFGEIKSEFSEETFKKGLKEIARYIGNAPSNGRIQDDRVLCSTQPRMGSFSFEEI